MKANPASILFLAGGACLLGLAACSSPTQYRSKVIAEASKLATDAKHPEIAAKLAEAAVTESSPRPRINSIGLQSIITFETSTLTKPTKILIPIEGAHLREPANPGAVNLAVQVVGTVPALPKIDYELVWPSQPGEPGSRADSELAYVQLNPDYVAKLKAHDRLRIIAAINRPAIAGTAGSHKFDETTAIAHREFTLYDVDTFRREVASARVPAHDIQAFPMPEKEVDYLFGPLVKRSYYVVRLTLRNTTGADKLVNSGLISATGRAIVTPSDKRQPTFTVPVTLSPQGPVQVYAILDDQTAWRKRPWVFRSLEFIGALGAVAVTTFPATPPDLAKGSTLFTGVFVPEMQKLWPDSWPGYKRNLVTFSMPELTKIPRQSTTAPKYLFFPKRELELFVSDQALFEIPGLPLLKKLPFRTSADDTKPTVRIVSLGFDSLDIPFENVVEPGQVSLASQLARVGERLEVRVGELTSFKHRLAAAAGTKEDAMVVDQVSKKQITASLTAITAARDAIKGKSETEVITDIAAGTEGEPKKSFTELKEALEGLVKVAENLAGFTKPESDLYKSALTDSSDAAFSLAALDKLRRSTIKEATADVLAYSESRSGQDKVDTVKQRLEASEALTKFITTAATLLTDQSLLTALDAIKTSGKADKAQRALINSVYATLKQARTVPVIPEFDPEGYAKLTTSVTTAPAETPQG